MIAEVRPPGTWSSPISADRVASGSIKLADLVVDGDDVFWVETRPAEGGRAVIVRRDAGGVVRDVLPAPFSARTRVHEYGGGAFTVAKGVIYFSSFVDHRVYRFTLGVDAAPEPITPAAAHRHADFVVDHARRRLVCVREDHTASDRAPANTLVTIALDPPGTVDVLVDGADFYSSPRISPDGATLAWLQWNHPNMPWTATELQLASLAPDGSVGSRELIAGGDGESIVQPEWSPDGVLHFVSDRNGWWNLYERRGDDVRAICPMEAELAYPQWIFGVSTYGFIGCDAIVCTYVERGRSRLGRLDRGTGTMRPFDLPYTRIESLRALRPRDDAPHASGTAVCIAAAPDQVAAIVGCDLGTGATVIVRRSSEPNIDPALWSVAESIAFPTGDGEAAYAYFYPPRNPAFIVPAGVLPPLIVKSHGGPTAAASSGLDLRIQYWTTRGFAVVDVDYRGSTGYGTAYRRALDGRWGIVDVEDCIAAARYLVAAGRVDGSRLAITGGSAGGYTTLCALTFHDVFHAGASYYGISDLEALAADTHKFEAHDHERLVGPYPERRDLYRARSPIHFADRLSCPVIFFQGSDDRVVLPNQAERMVAALRARGLAVDYLVFEGEGHGFRRAATITRALEAELAFYTRVFGLTLPTE